MANDQQIEKIKFCVQEVVNQYLVCDQSLQLTVPIFKNKKVYSVWDHSEATDGVKVLRYLLATQLVLNLNILLFDKGSNLASLKQTIERLKDAEVASTLKDSFVKPNGVTVCGEHTPEEKKRLIETIQTEDTQNKIEVFDKTLKRVIRQYSNIDRSKIGVAIKEARSKAVAHKQIHTPEDERQLFELSDFGFSLLDLQRFLKRVEKIIFDSYLLITNSSYSIRSFTKHHKKVSSEFWKIQKA